MNSLLHPSMLDAFVLSDGLSSKQVLVLASITLAGALKKPSRRKALARRVGKEWTIFQGWFGTCMRDLSYRHPMLASSMTVGVVWMHYMFSLILGFYTIALAGLFSNLTKDHLLALPIGMALTGFMGISAFVMYFQGRDLRFAQ